MKDIWRRCAEEAALPISVEGVFPCMAHLSFAAPEADVVRTLYTQEMLKRGFLAGAGYYPTLAHTERDMIGFEQAVAEVFGTLGTWRREDCLRDRLEGPVAHSGFRRLAR